MWIRGKSIAASANVRSQGPAGASAPRTAAAARAATRRTDCNAEHNPHGPSGPTDSSLCPWPSCAKLRRPVRCSLVREFADDRLGQHNPKLRDRCYSEAQEMAEVLGR